MENVVYETADTNVYELPPVWQPFKLSRVSLMNTRNSQASSLNGLWVARPILGTAAAVQQLTANDDGNSPLATARSMLTPRTPMLSPSKMLASVKNIITGGGKAEEKSPGAGTALGDDTLEAALMPTDEEIQKHAMNTAIEGEVQARLEMLRYLRIAEERERIIMVEEERLMREYIVDDILARGKPLLDAQVEIATQWGKMMERIRCASELLQRIRFLHGTKTDTGGLVVYCEDSSTLQPLTVNVIPILYPEDEDFLMQNLFVLLGKQHPNLTRIVEYSAHNVQFFPHSGFASNQDRVVVVVLERPPDSLNLMQHFRATWQTLKETEFVFLLKQVVEALAGLHEDGVVHRNLGPESVGIRSVNATNTLVRNMASKRSRGMLAGMQKTRQQLLCTLEKYWFLENPRHTGCEYSLGRADWGSRSTRPPEARGTASTNADGGDIITDRSDIFAFGLCVYYWATAGTIDELPVVPPRTASDYDLHLLKDSLPLRWGLWVFELIRTCVHTDPVERPTAKQLVQSLEEIERALNRI
jgi:hypothetical protein